MRFTLSHTLSQTELTEVLKIYNAIDTVSIEQFPGFAPAAGPDSDSLYFLAHDQMELCAYACIQVKKKILASVMFGPVVKQSGDFEEIYQGLISMCRRRGILVLRIMPPYMADADKTGLETMRIYNPKFSENEISWQSLRLSLQKPLEELLKNFSENHRRNIKKAIKLNLKTEKIERLSEIDIFSEQYIQMYQSRGLHISKETTNQIFRNLFTFFQNNGDGLFLAVKSEEGAMVGGLCITYQGNAAFYYKGYSHPEHRNLPINHLAFYDAMAIAKERGISYFDFGGYAENVKEGDQLYAINKFKDGFGGELIIYPRTMLIYTSAFGRLLYSLYRRLRKEPS